MKKRYDTRKCIGNIKTLKLLMPLFVPRSIVAKGPNQPKRLGRLAQAAVKSGQPVWPGICGAF